MSEQPWKEVTKCSNCPFRNSDFEQGYDCNHPDAEPYIIGYAAGDEAPPECPLRKQPITIIFKP